jgi:hypothetical protein
MEDGIKFALINRVKHFLLKSHEPFMSDAQLTDILSELKKKTTVPFKYELAKKE